MKRLFVGGHWHGRVSDVPDGLGAYRVPVPETSFYSYFTMTDRIVSGETQLYYRHRVMVRGRVVEVMVYDKVARNIDDLALVDYLLDAALRAGGVA